MSKATPQLHTMTELVTGKIYCRKQSTGDWVVILNNASDYRSTNGLSGGYGSRVRVSPL